MDKNVPVERQNLRIKGRLRVSAMRLYEIDKYKNKKEALPYTPRVTTRIVSSQKMGHRCSANQELIAVANVERCSVKSDCLYEGPEHRCCGYHTNGQNPAHVVAHHGCRLPLSRTKFPGCVDDTNVNDEPWHEADGLRDRSWGNDAK